MNPSPTHQAEQTEIESLKARLAAMEVELIRARQLSVDEIRTKSGPFSFFDRHGMMGLLFAVFVQTAGVIWWASTITGKVNELQSAFERQSEMQQMMAKNISENADRLTRVQTVQENVVKILDSIVYTDKFLPNRQDGGEPRGPRP